MTNKYIPMATNFYQRYSNRLSNDKPLNNAEWQEIVDHITHDPDCVEQGITLLDNLHKPQHQAIKVMDDLKQGIQVRIMYLGEEAEKAIMSINWFFRGLMPQIAMTHALKSGVGLPVLEKLVQQFNLSGKESGSPIMGSLYTSDHQSYRLVVQVGHFPKYVAGAEVRVNLGDWNAVGITNKQGKAEFTQIPHTWLHSQSIQIEVQTHSF